MSTIRETTLKSYLQDLIQTPRIHNYLEQFLDLNGYEFQADFKVINKTFKATVAGYSKGDSFFYIAKWILADATEAKCVVRHELAHLIHSYSDLQGMAHGKEFLSSLRLVSPLRWRRDRHCHSTPKIEEARGEVHKIQKRFFTSRGVHTNLYR